MSQRPERPVVAISVPMNTGAGMSPSVGVAAPIGAVSRKDRGRAGATSLEREGTSLVLHTALQGSVSLQRRVVGGTWETLEVRPSSRDGRTTIALPQDAAAAPPTFRVVFAPKNANINAWISEDVVG